MSVPAFAVRQPVLVDLVAISMVVVGAATMTKGETKSLRATSESCSTGPEDALILMHREGRRWREIEG